MPHLSPMSWMFTSMTIWTMVLTISSSMWWINTYKFNSSLIKHDNTINNVWVW